MMHVLVLTIPREKICFKVMTCPTSILYLYLSILEVFVKLVITYFMIVLTMFIETGSERVVGPEKMETGPST